MYFENLKRPKFRGVYYFENLKRFTLILATFMLKKTITMVPWPLSVGCYRVILEP